MIMLGKLPKNFGEMKKGNIPKNEKDRSMFSQVRYSFFLDAPFEISNRCCNIMKKEPLHRYEKETGRKPITAQMAEESRLRKQKWLMNGCNGFQMKNPISNPMSFWTEQDILQYIVKHDLEICSVYGDIVPDDDCEGQLSFLETNKKLKCTGCKRTGCMMCGFGCHLEKPGEGRFERLKCTHPKMYGFLDIAKNNGVTFRQAIEWTNEHGGTNIRL